jgi:5-methylcytosine-specific restriction endonuclease McrA
VYQIKKCSNCQKNLPIINVKYNICSNCNSVRLWGKSQSERQKEQSIKYRKNALQRYRAKVTIETDTFLQPVIKLPVKAKKPLSTTTRIKAQTTEEALIKKQLSALKQEIRLEAVQNNEYYCCGCGKTGVLDCSHILSVGQFKHLELVKENIQLLCRECHHQWENKNIQQVIKLHCFVDNMYILAKYDKASYNKLITKIEDYQVWITDEQEKQFVKELLEKL